MEADGGKSRVRLVMREAPQLVFPVLSSLVFLSIMLHYDASMLLKAFLLVAMGVTLTALITHMLLIRYVICRKVRQFCYRVTLVCRSQRDKFACSQVRRLKFRSK